MAGETGNGTAVVLPGSVATGTESFVKSGNCEYCIVHPAAVVAGAVGAAWGIGSIVAVVGEGGIC